MYELCVIKIGNEEVKLDPEHLNFNESNLSQYLEKEGSWYNYFGIKLATAEFLMQRRELEYDVVYSEKFKTNKENGSSDKLAEAQAKCNTDVETAMVGFLTAKHNVRLLQQHLKAWDKNHDNAMSRGHFLRKEMDKLNPSVLGQRSENYLERQIENIVKEVSMEDLN